jgi:glutaredoxin/cytochrome c biogenesis protein CcdA
MKQTFINGFKFYNSMKIKNKSKIIVLFLSFLILLPFLVFGQAEKDYSDVTIHFFNQKGCPDCARQKEFLDNFIKTEFPGINIVSYSIADLENQELFYKMMDERNVTGFRMTVPTTFIDNMYFQNFYKEDEKLLRRAINGENVQNEFLRVRGEHLIHIPIFGEVNVGKLSIPLLAMIIGLLDGLNVCSIGALILIITLVLGAFNSRLKMFFYGGIFILTTAIVYGILVFAWTTLSRVIETYIGFLNVIIGIAALLGGIYFFKKFIDFYRYGPGCEFSGNKYLVKATKKLKKTFSDSKSGFFALTLGVIIFAGIVTIIELPCSIALPMVYGSILAENGLSVLSHFLYVLLYLFFYMFIQLVIFLGAVITKDLWFANSKFITWVYLAGSFVLFGLAYYYIIRFF